VASCTYFRYGKGGRQEALQALCILALNIVIGRAVAGANRPKFQLAGSKVIDYEKFCKQKKRVTFLLYFGNFIITV
jgi:hypothetical protein